jgi:tRNA-Thr(GGU) m(6)t(6)A37 methyltransferase TsaA
MKNKPMYSQMITFQPIGIIRTPHKDIREMPIQPLAANGIRGQVEIYPPYMDGLKDLNGFSHVTLIYHFHKVKGYELQVVPFMDTEKRGIFACKAPKRSNAIGISTVKLISVHNNILTIEEVDMLDGTPLIDIKPFYPRYDNRDNVSIGWLEKNKNISVSKMQSDDRFS